jgi:hypothetical protein
VNKQADNDVKKSAQKIPFELKDKNKQKHISALDLNTLKVCKT